MVKQAELNAALDLDKHEAQVVADAPTESPEKSDGKSFRDRACAQRYAKRRWRNSAAMQRTVAQRMIHFALGALRVLLIALYY